MKLLYDPDTDSLYIDLNDRPGADAHEIADGVVLDLDATGRSGSTSSTPPAASTSRPWRPDRCQRASSSWPERRCSETSRRDLVGDQRGVEHPRRDSHAKK
jgi:hypothetical protein